MINNERREYLKNLGKKVRELRQSLGLSQEELATAMNYKGKSSINKIEMGINDIPQSKIVLLANALHVTPAELLSDQTTVKPDYSHIRNVLPMPEMKKLPLVGGIACGTPILAEQNIEDEIDVPSHIKADFVLRCNGDSMINARINDGDYVCIRIQPDVDDGQIAAVLIGDSATLKRVYHQKNGVTLMAENPKYSPMVYIGEECEDIRIMGKAVAFISEID